MSAYRGPGVPVQPSGGGDLQLAGAGLHPGLGQAAGGGVHVDGGLRDQVRTERGEGRRVHNSAQHLRSEGLSADHGLVQEQYSG